MIYKVIKCPNCRKLVITTAEDTFKCMFCSKTKKIKELNILYSSHEPKKTQQFIKFKKRDDYFNKNDEIWIL